MHRIYQQVSSQLEKKNQPSYKEKKELEARTRELAELPAKIEALENEQNLLSLQNCRFHILSTRQ